MIIGKFALDAAVGVRATLDAPSATGIVNGGAYLDDVSGLSYVCVSTDSVAASDGVIGGFRYTTAGALRVYDATAGVPADASVNQGIAMTSDGQVCFTTEAGTARLNGVPLSSDGAVSMGVMTFLAEFADLGGGEVDTAVTFGGVSATFTRATTATTVDSAGLIVSVASGVARSYYDPTTLEYLGYLAEGARTNLCLQSEDLATTWTNSNSTDSVNAAVSPDGAITADKLIENTATALHLVSQSIALAASTATVSLFAKAAERPRVALILSSAFFTDAVARQATFNLTTGTVAGTAGTGATATIQAFPNGWYRCTMTAPVDVATTNSLFIVLDNGTTQNYLGDGTSGLYLWGMQCEQAAFASSYIPTTTASVTRNADVLTYPTTGWYSATTGTFFARATPLSGSVAFTQAACGVYTNTSNYISIEKFNANVSGNVVDGGVTQAAMASTATTNGTSFSGAIAYEANNGAASFNGGTVGTDTSMTIPTITTAGVGQIGGANQWFGPIRRVSYFNARLPNATLQALTA